MQDDKLFEKLVAKFPYNRDDFDSLAAKTARKGMATRKMRLISRVWQVQRLIDSCVILGPGNRNDTVFIRAMASRHFALKKIRSYVR